MNFDPLRVLQGKIGKAVADFWYTVEDTGFTKVGCGAPHYYLLVFGNAFCTGLPNCV